MRYFILLISFVLPFFLFGQGYSLKGKIIDFTTKEPVPNLPVRAFYEDYSNADTIREVLWLDLMGDKKKDTIYLKPILKFIDSTVGDRNGHFAFYSLPEGMYKISCVIRKVEKGYIGDTREHIAVHDDSVTVELTPKVFCEYGKYQNQDSCPVCLKKDNCLKVVYGLPVYDPDTNGILSKKDEYWIGYCETDPFCYARWYCIKCDKLF